MEPHPYLNRLQGPKIKKLFDYFPVVVVSGARQVGKSTLLTHSFPDFPRVVFDPVIDVENARADPELFLANRRPPVILDEIQYAPELVPALKRALETDRQPGQFLITGSQQWGVMKLLAESLAGRAAFIDLDAFSLAEIAEVEAEDLWLEKWLSDPSSFGTSSLARLPIRFPIAEQIWRGFLPEAQFLPRELIPDFHAAYQRTYVERDIRQMGDVADLQLFGRFCRLCAALTAQEINFSELGRELGITPQTAARWLDLLTSTFLWFEIPPYSGNTIKRISHKPKAYLQDTGLTCWSLAISAPEAVSAHPAWGALFETAVVLEIRKQSHLMATPPNFYHWRSHGGAEVDLLLEWSGQYYPIEIKGSSRPKRSDTRGIQAFRSTYPRLAISPGLVIAPADSCYPLTETEYVIPWDVK